MPRKARKGEVSTSITNTKIRDQVLPRIKRNKRRRIYLKYNATGAKKKYGHYASSCRSSIKRKHEASTADVEEVPPHKEPRKDDRSKFFF